jgi:hypothetical protein
MLNISAASLRGIRELMSSAPRAKNPHLQTNDALTIIEFDANLMAHL